MWRVDWARSLWCHNIGQISQSKGVKILLQRDPVIFMEVCAQSLYGQCSILCDLVFLMPPTAGIIISRSMAIA